VITVFPGNHGTIRDSHQGAVLLFDSATGSLDAVCDATAITSIRTAAVSALATRLLGRADADDLAILGSGVQARMHLEAIPLVRKIGKVRIWSRDFANARRLADSFRGKIEIEACKSARDAVEGASIVCTTTSSTEPVLHGEWLSPGVHVNAVGACTPSARELDTAAVVRSRLFVDRRDSALAEPGDIRVPIGEGAITADHIVAELGEVIIGSGTGRRSESEITLFKSLGLAVEDIAAARYVYDLALQRGAGTRVELGGNRNAAP
jgi:ornithine cyclodeaminase